MNSARNCFASQTPTGDTMKGAQIRARRKAVGLTQAELARAVRLTKQAISHIERAVDGVGSAGEQLVCMALKRAEGFRKKYPSATGKGLTRMILKWFKRMGVEE